jgi:hypothetical protein
MYMCTVVVVMRETWDIWRLGFEKIDCFGDSHDDLPVSLRFYKFRIKFENSESISKNLESIFKKLESY